MKLIYIQNARIPSERAHAIQIAHTCAALGAAGHEVTLATPDRTHGADVFDVLGVPRGSFTHVALKAWDPLSTWSVFKTAAYVLQRNAFLRATAKWLRTQTADVWYTRDVTIVLKLAEKVRGPWVLELHDIDAKLQKKWQQVRVRVAQFVVISHGIEERLIQMGVPAEQITRAPDGVDLNEFTQLPSRAEARAALDIPEHAFVAVYAGGFYPWKGVDMVARMADRLPETACLIMAGGPPQDQARVAALIPSMALSHIRLLPSVSRAEIPQLYAAADIGLLTTSSQHEIGREFTSPLKQFEYLAAGLPVLASDVPSSHEVLTEEVARFYPPTEDGFVETFVRMQEDEAWRTAAHANAPRLAAQYTWENRAKQITSALQKALRSA